MKKILTIVLAGVLMFSLFACGGTDSGSTEGGAEEEIKGQAETFGKISVFVPEGMTGRIGDMANEEDDSSAFITSDPTGFSNYILVTMFDAEESCEGSFNMTKEINEDCGVTEFEVKTDAAAWKALHYNSFDIDCITAYATVEGQPFLVNMTGYAMTDPGVSKILNSVKAAE